MGAGTTTAFSFRRRPVRALEAMWDRQVRREQPVHRGRRGLTGRREHRGLPEPLAPRAPRVQKVRQARLDPPEAPKVIRVTRVQPGRLVPLDPPEQRDPTDHKAP